MPISGCAHTADTRLIQTYSRCDVDTADIASIFDSTLPSSRGFLAIDTHLAVLVLCVTQELRLGTLLLVVALIAFGMAPLR